MPHQRHTAPTRRGLERSFAKRPAIHSTDVWANADFTGCPRPPLMQGHVSWLESWRVIDWAGSPGLQSILSIDNETLLATYRRIWGKTPTHRVVRNRVGRTVRDFLVCQGELQLMAFHLLGYKREKGAPVDRLIAEKPKGAWF